MDPRDEEMAELIAASRAVNGLACSGADAASSRRETPSTARTRDAQFIRIPLRIFEVLVPLPGKALAVYELLWRHYCMEHQPVTVQLTAGERRRCKLTRWQTDRALTTLEETGLIQIERRVGKSPRITVRPLADLFPTPEGRS